MSGDRVESAIVQVVVDEITRKIFSLEQERAKMMDTFGRCGRWLDGHSHRKCRRLSGHAGGCGERDE